MNESTFLHVENNPPPARGALAVITCEKVGGREAPIVQQELTVAGESAGWRLAVDLAAVTMLSSIGLGALVMLHKKCREEGGVFVVCGIGKELRELLKITHLDRVLTIVKDAAAGVKAVS